MIKLFFTLLLSHLFYFCAQGQAIREVTLPFNTGQCSQMETDVQWVIDQVYYSLRPLEKVRLLPYTPEERMNFSLSQLTSVAAKREVLVRKYLSLRKSVPLSKIKSLIPFDTISVFDASVSTNRSSVSPNRYIPGLASVILSNTEPFHKIYPHLSDSLLTRNKQEFKLRCYYNSWVTTIQGVQIRIEPNTFITEGNNSPACCDIRFIVEEYLATSDMLLADLVTHSSGMMLESGGMVYLEAWCGNEKLKIAPGKSIHILFPSSEKKEGMKAFNGRKTNEYSDWIIQQNGKVYIAPEDTERLFPQVSDSVLGEGEYSSREIFYEGSELGDGYLLKSCNLGWINCDRFYEIEEKTTLTVQSDKQENICFRLVFKKIRSILPAFMVIPGMLFKFEGLPKGEQAMLLGYWISNDRKKAYVSWKEITIGENAEEKMIMKEINGGQLAVLLKELFPV